MVGTVSGCSRPLGEISSEPLWTCVLLRSFFVTAHDVGTLTSSQGPPWGQTGGAKIEGTLPECRGVDRLSLMSSHRGQAERPSPQSPGVLRSGSSSIIELAGSQTDGRESSVSNQTPACLWQICPHRPFSEQSTAESRTNTSLKGPVFHLIEFKLSVQKPWCFFISSVPSAAAEGIPWAPIPPTSQDLLTWEVCHYCSFPIVLKQCPRLVTEGLAENLGAHIDNTSVELSGKSYLLIIASGAWVGNKIKTFLKTQFQKSHTRLMELESQMLGPGNVSFETSTIS